MNRRDFLEAAAVAVPAEAVQAQQQAERDAPIRAREPLRITRLETFLVRPRWMFLKVQHPQAHEEHNEPEKKNDHGKA